MTLQSVLDLFSAYGIWWIAGICFCEYLNLPGFPAGVILPAIGVLVSQSDLHFVTAIVVSTVAGLAGSAVLYAICRYGGAPVLDKLFGNSKTYHKIYDKAHKRLSDGGGKALLICRLIPVLRTIVSLPAGLVGMGWHEFLTYSALGIAIWNTVFILLGYAGGRGFGGYW